MKKDKTAEPETPTTAEPAKTRAGTTTVILKKEHTHRGLRIPAGARLELLPRQAAALKAAGLAE